MPQETTLTGDVIDQNGSTAGRNESCDALTHWPRSLRLSRSTKLSRRCTNLVRHDADITTSPVDKRDCAVIELDKLANAIKDQRKHTLDGERRGKQTSNVGDYLLRPISPWSAVSNGTNQPPPQRTRARLHPERRDQCRNNLRTGFSLALAQHADVAGADMSPQRKFARLHIASFQALVQPGTEFRASRRLGRCGTRWCHKAILQEVNW